MTSVKRTARIAGLWYLGFTLGPFYLLYVPSQTVVHNDAAATAARVLGHESSTVGACLPRRSSRSSSSA